MNLDTEAAESDVEKRDCPHGQGDRGTAICVLIGAGLAIHQRALNVIPGGLVHECPKFDVFSD